MSMESMGKARSHCPCGAGWVVVESFMDDWNRTGKSVHYECPKCAKAASDEERREREREQDNTRRENQAKALFKKRHLEKWLSLYDGLNKKASWRRLTNNGKRYPTLSAFYNHVAPHASAQEYLRDTFDLHIKDALASGDVKDQEIAELLNGRGYPSRRAGQVEGYQGHY